MLLAAVWVFVAGGVVVVVRVWRAEKVDSRLARLRPAQARTVLPTAVGALAIAAAVTFPSVGLAFWLLAAATVVWDLAIVWFRWPRWSIPPVYRE